MKPEADRGVRAIRRTVSRGVSCLGLALVAILTVPAVLLLGLASLVRSAADRISARLECD